MRPAFPPVIPSARASRRSSSPVLHYAHMPPLEHAQSTPPTAESKKPSGMGPLLGIVIILAMILVGAFYFWGRALNQRDSNPPPYIPDQTATS